MITFQANGGSLIRLQNALRQEAGIALNLGSDDAMVTDSCSHGQEAINCSCSVASDIHSYGLFSTLHCRREIDGTVCSAPGCPYSHLKLEDGKFEHPTLVNYPNTDIYQWSLTRINHLIVASAQKHLVRVHALPMPHF